ncbi:hypothetical protein QAD02_015118, partial [Eretmocerus hayati]
ILKTEEVERQIREIIGRAHVPGTLSKVSLDAASKGRSRKPPRKRRKIGHREEKIERKNLIALDNEVGDNSVKISSTEQLRETRRTFRIRKNGTSYYEGSRVRLKNQTHIDRENPIYHAPFNFGWKREVVHRLNGKFIDVYYYPPKIEEDKKESKKQTMHKMVSKLRSYTEIAKYLEVFYKNRALTIDNFTFVKESLGFNDPEKDVVRCAKDMFAKEKSKETTFDQVPLIETRKRSEVPQIEKMLDGKSKLNGLTEKCPNKLVTSKIKYCPNDKVPETSSFVPPEENRSPQVSTSTEQMPFTSQKDLNVTDSRKKSAETPLLSSSKSSIQLRARVHQPLYDEDLIMRKLRYVPVTKVSRRKSRAGGLNGIKRQAKSSPITPILCVVSSSVQDASLNIPLSSTASESCQVNPAFLDVDPLALPEPKSNLRSETSPTRESQLDEQMAESHDQISSTFDSISREMSTSNEGFKIEPEVYVVGPNSNILDGRDFVCISDDCSGEIFQLKVFMREVNSLNDEVEIRRFSIEFDAAPIYTRLCMTLENIFPNLKNRSFTLEWEDSEGDRVSISSSVELREAIESMRNCKVMKFYLTAGGCDTLSSSITRAKNISLKPYDVRFARMEEIEIQIQKNIEKGHFLDYEHADTESEFRSQQKCRSVPLRKRSTDTAPLANGGQTDFVYSDDGIKGKGNKSEETFSPERKRSKRPRGSSDSEKSKKGLDSDRRLSRSNNRESLDVTNPLYHLPFAYGWRRELVNRVDGRHSDVYYYPPKHENTDTKKSQESLATNEVGKKNKDKDKKTFPRNQYKTCPKLRSYVEIAKYLQSHPEYSNLKVENFTFTKQLLLGHVNSDRECVRQAVPNWDRGRKKEEKLKGSQKSSRKSDSNDQIPVGSMLNAGDQSLLFQNSFVTTEEALQSGYSGDDRFTIEVDPHAIGNPTVLSSIPSSEIQSREASTSSEQKENQDNVFQTLSPKLSDSSILLRPRVQKPIYDENIIMRNLKTRTVMKPPRQPGRPKGAKNRKRHKESPANGRLSTSHTVVSDASSTTIFPTSETSQNIDRVIQHVSSVDFNPLNSSHVQPNIPAQEVSAQEFQSDKSSVEEQTPVNQNQISSTLDSMSKNLNTEPEEIKTEPEICIVEPELQPKIENMETTEFGNVNQRCTPEIYQFKVFMKEENAPDDKVEIRRFSTSFDATPMYTHLCNMLLTVFPNLKNASFTLEWKDAEGDRILVSSCLELKESLKVMRNYKVMKFYLTVRSCKTLYD